MSQPITAGSFLVATPSLLDPNFVQTVVLMCSHNEEGSFGLIVNRRLHLPFNHILQQMNDLPDSCDPNADYGPVYLGGPVDRHRLLALRHSMAPSLGGDDQPVISGVHLINDLHATLVGVGSQSIHPSQVRFLLGYAGWGEGQLDQEVEEGSWEVRPGNARLIFATRTDAMWSAALGIDDEGEMGPSMPSPSLN